jgi:hypothetical protein
VLTSGETLSVDFLFAHYGAEALKDAKLEWCFDICDGALLRHPGNMSVSSTCGRIPVGDITIGPARKVASEKIAIPQVSKAAKAVLRVKIGATANEWEFWVFPKRGRRDGSDIAVDAALLPAFGKLYNGLADIGSARLVIAPYGSKTAADALYSGKRVLTISGGDGKPNVSLGWWSIGNQVGTALSRKCSALSGLPHEGVLSPLLFRVIKEGAYPLSAGDVKTVEPMIVGEGRDDCYLYLGEIKAERARHIASFGLDLLSGTPEGTAILDGIIDSLRK